MITYVTYFLDWKDGCGHQPYEQLSSLDVNFEGGIALINGVYLGKITGGEEKNINNAIDACQKFGMKKLNEIEVETFLEGTMINVNIIDRIVAVEDAVLSIITK